MSCGLFKNTNHHRSGLIAMMVFALLGCGKGTPATSIHPTPTANQVFAEFDPHLDAPKTALNLALNQHLSNERYSVVNYYHQTKPLAVSPLDKNADTLWESVIKMGEYQAKTAKNSTDAYLTHDEYFAKDDLYLRYYDEKNNTLPQDGYELSRSAGLENSIQYADKQVRGLAGRYKSCVTETAHDVDELVKKTPAITTKHPAIKNRLDHLDTCLKQSNDAYVLLFENLTAYQALDLDHIKGCVGRYRKNLSTALAKNRAIARYEGDDYDVYETIYGNFAVCHAGFEMGYRLDPVYYTESAYTYDRIEQIHQNRLCALQNRDEQESLDQNRQSYATDPKAHTSSFYRYFECLDKAVLGDDGEREPVLPVSIATAQAQYELYKEWLEFKDTVDDNDTDETSWLDDFFAMKQQPQDTPKPKDTIWGDLGGEYGVMADGLLKLMKKTPEQALAKNLYQHNHTQITLLSHHRPQDKVVSSVMAMDFDTPTATQKLTVPFYADFKKEHFIGDVSPVLPVLTVINPKNTPIFEQIPLGKLQLPQELSVVPLTLFYDALQKGYVQAMADLPTANFSQIVPATAPFNERFGATQVIKLTLSSKELGQMVGVMAKQLEHELSAFIDAHPEQFDEQDGKDGEQDQNSDVQAKRLAKQKALKDFVKKWAMLNQGYQTGDVASAVQLVEAVLPIGLGQSHYFYLNKGKLVAHVRQTTVSQALARTQDVQLMVAQFDKSAFDKHALSAKLPSALLNSSPKKSPTPEPFALNDWLKTLVAEHGYLQSAKMARLLALEDEYETGLADEQDNKMHDETSDDKNN